MKSKNPIEETQKLKSEKEYFENKYKEAKTVIREKDKLIAELKKNLDNFLTRIHLLLC